ncbi:hypothetical protein [Microcystis aeruginosa]|uniref:hypothetical protein n=1 Tax=Microcystis aeruginosa TaxID=1126 RepID=UPI0035B671E1
MIRRDGKDDIYHNPDTGKTEPIPRHREINERLVNKIIKSLTDERSIDSANQTTRQGSRGAIEK